MKALRWYKAGDIRIEDIPEPVVRDDDVKIRVKWCGICGSDLHEYLMGPIFIPVDRPHPLSGEKAPVVLGHEFSGEVAEVGKNVTHVKPGDRVVVEPLLACGQCHGCRSGRPNLCEKLGFHGLAGGGGGFAEYTTFTSRFVHKIPDALPYDKAALVEPMSVALHSTEVGVFQKGQNAVVTGAGPIGLATIECLRALGAARVIVVQRKSIRQEYAKHSGADIVLDPSETDVVAEIRRLTDGAGADVAFETTGSEQVFTLVLDAVRSGGRFVITSIWEKPVTFNLNSLVIPEKNIAGSICYNNDFPKVIAMMADGRIKADGYITKKIALDDIIEKGFGTLTGPEKKKQVKILVTPDPSLL